MLSMKNINKEMSCPGVVDDSYLQEGSDEKRLRNINSNLFIPFEITIPSDCDEQMDSDDISTLSSDLVDDFQEWDRQDQIDFQQEPRGSKLHQQPRSIFQSYWKETNESPTLVRPSCIPSASESPASPRGVAEPFLYSTAPPPLIPLLFEMTEKDPQEEDQDKDSYERLLNQVECKQRMAIKKPNPTGILASPYNSRPLGETRRSWGNLLGRGNIGGKGVVRWDTRATKSDSALNDRHNKKLRSCLRQCRYSPNSATNMTCCSQQSLSTSIAQKQQQQQQQQHRQSVSFNPKIEVVKYQIPIEIWAADGWSSWFDYHGRS